jgi:hypothetical protein
MAESGFEGQETSPNNAFTLQGVLMGIPAHTVSPGGKRR